MKQLRTDEQKYRIVEEVDALGDSNFIAQVSTDGKNWAFLYERTILGHVSVRSSFSIPIETYRFISFERAKSVIEKYKETLERTRKYELSKQIVETKYHEV